LHSSPTYEQWKGGLFIKQPVCRTWEKISVDEFMAKYDLCEALVTNFELFLSLLINFGDIFQDQPGNGNYFNQMLETDSTFKNILVTPDEYPAGWATSLTR
jgi:hypothetical protein